MDPLTAGAAMAGASAIGGGIQQFMSNRFQRDEGKRSRRFNAREAEKQRSWQEQMRATQYQTSRDDMIAAGINPLLMAGGKAQAAGTPSGASASSSPVSMQSQDPVGKAIGGAGVAVNMRMAKAQARHAEAQAVMAEQGAYKAEFFGKLWDTANKVLDDLTDALQRIPATRAPLPYIKEKVEELQETLPKLSPEEKQAIRERLDEATEEMRRQGKRVPQWLRDAWKRLRDGYTTHHWTPEGR